MAYLHHFPFLKWDGQPDVQSFSKWFWSAYDGQDPHARCWGGLGTSMSMHSGEQQGHGMMGAGNDQIRTNRGTLHSKSNRYTMLVAYVI